MDKIKLEARRKARTEQKSLAEIEAQKNQKEVSSMTITIEWVKSKTWGMNPHAGVRVSYKDGKSEYRDGYSCSGCGYDKQSTVIADIFNDFLRYKLYQLHKWEDSINGEKTSYPYGVYYYNGDIGKKLESGYISKPTFNGGVGTSCYYKIAEFIGGEFKNLSSGKSFDVFQYVDNQ